jgi:hypothetical protein
MRPSMNKTIEILDVDERGYLRVDLRELLVAVSSVGPDCRWTFTRLEARGDVASVWPNGMLDLEQAAASAEGAQLEWRDLVRLSEQIVQTIDCRLVALSKVSDRVVLTIEVIDSSCCRFSSDDPKLVAEVARQFANVRESG